MFFAKRCQGPNKTASAAEKFSVKECEEERDRRQKLAKKESEHPEKENRIKINTYLQHRVFLSLR